MTEEDKPAGPVDGSGPVEEAPAEPTVDELLSQERDRYLRLAAEFDNFRKRLQPDKRFAPE